MEAILKKVTMERLEQATAIINAIDEKAPRYKQIASLNEAYKIFGITATWNPRYKSVHLSLLCKDSQSRGNNSCFSGTSIEIKPFKYAKEIMTHLISFRLAFLDNARGNDELLSMIEM